MRSRSNHQCKKKKNEAQSHKQLAITGRLPTVRNINEPNTHQNVKDPKVVQEDYIVKDNLKWI